jgi:hypothetical protein
MTRHLSSLAIDALALDALPRDGAERAHLATCTVCKARVDDAQALRAQLPPRVMVRTLEALDRRARFAVAFRVIAPLAVAAALVVVVLTRTTVPERAPDAAPELAIKGKPDLQVYALRDRRVFRVDDGDALIAGDEIRFAVTPAGAGYVLIASLDGAGRATIYVPYGGGSSVAVDAHARTELPGSIVLDDAPGPERVFAVFTPSPIPAGDVQVALQRLAAVGPEQLRGSPRLDLVVPATQVSMRFEKAVP